jgi:hypothetical protein
MRSLAMIALGSFVASTCLTGQSLSEHAAAAAGATVGTAAGKPLGTALGKIFGDVDKSTSNASGAKVVKPPQPKVQVTTSAPALAPAPSAPLGASGGSGESGGSSGAGSAVASTRHTSRRRESPAAAAPLASAPITPVVVEPVVPVVKEPSVEEIAAVKVGATSHELEAALGAPESRVSIPDDDGHLLEICQYWSKGQPLGTVRLDNGRVVSVQTRAY